MENFAVAITMMGQPTHQILLPRIASSAEKKT